MTLAVVANLLATAALAITVLVLAYDVRRTHRHVNQTHAAARQLLAHVPGKSAPRTDGAAEQPREWWQRLRALGDRDTLNARLADDMRQVRDQAALPAGGRHRAPDEKEAA